jgi:hypothetical protein
MPTMAWVILVLGIVWFVLRQLAARAEDKRRMRHEERVAELLAEREALRAREEAPSSLAATTSETDEQAPAAEARAVVREQVKVRCRACRALNDEEEKTCASCGAAL